MNITDLPHRLLSTAAGFLDSCRRERLDKTRNERVKLELVATDALVKYAVSSECRVSPVDVKAAYDSCDAPFLVNAPLKISITHTEAAVFVALSQSKIGVDAELIRPLKYDALADRYFTAGEKAILFDSEDKILSALEIWTAKEAYFKYEGSKYKSLLAVDTSALPSPKRINIGGHIVSAVDPCDDLLEAICVDPSDIIKMYGEVDG